MVSLNSDLSPSPLGRAIQPTNLMTEDDLIPNMQDLDKMFDTDDEGDLDSVRILFVLFVNYLFIYYFESIQVTGAIYVR